MSARGQRPEARRAALEREVAAGNRRCPRCGLRRADVVVDGTDDLDRPVLLESCRLCAVSPARVVSPQGAA